ncbi:MAG: phosphoribosylaminoimidazolesuccinocarboxamide synthase, partial [Elusimicrobiota bacterium]
MENSSIPGLKLLRRGKVRDLYDLGDKLLLVASDRVSAFDCVLSPPIPGKGAVLTRLSAFWFGLVSPLVETHFLSADLSEIRRALPPGIRLDPELFDGRVTLARKAERVDAECVVRGYLAGSAWKEYRSTGSVCGHALPKGLRESERLEEPIFTPAAKADTGHDENISREELATAVGKDVARELETLSLKLYRSAAEHIAAKGLLLADTKFEFG